MNKTWGSNSTLTAQAQPALDAAASNWTNSTGPQDFVPWGYGGTPSMNVYTQVYPDVQPSDTTFRNALQSGAIAVTKNWSFNGSSYYQCYDASVGNNACVVYFSEIYVNQNLWQSCGSYWSPYNWQYIYAHELGHVQGLYEHPGNTAVLMDNYWSSYPCDRSGGNGVTSTDLGSPIPAGQTYCGSLRGIRCIFQWDH